jgi:dTDP-4-dehydrorhamnose 3,5-epimerase
MEIVTTKLENLLIITPEVFKDNRGLFYEVYSEKKFIDVGIKVKFVQDNHSLSIQKNIIRGLHFQTPPFSQAKLVRVTKGAVFDVVVDLRKQSKTFGQWQGFELTEDNFSMLFIPKGFAHGYCTLEQNTEFLYKTDNFYAPDFEGAIRWDDPDLNISWPVTDPVLSKKDCEAHFFMEFNSPF